MAGAERSGRRWAAVVLLLALGLGGLWALDRAVQQRMHRPGQLATRLDELQLAPDQRHAVILGTCLSEQHIQPDMLDAGLPRAWTVSNLGAASTTPVEWYLAWKNALADRGLEALIIAYGRFDLTEPSMPWESETLDLLGPGDLSQLAAARCDSSECTLDLHMQHASALWRYRPLLGAMVWHALGMAPPVDDKQARLRVVAGQREASADVWQEDNPSVIYLERLLVEARAAGVQVFLLPLPLRADAMEPRRAADFAVLNNEIGRLAERTGAVRLPSPAMDRALFEDEVHLNAEGMRVYTAWLAQDLGPRLPAD